jgi:hypothetical protein
MPSPFPGLDPYIELQDRWHSFHTSFIVACSDALNDRLPPGYYATVEERVLLDAGDPEDLSSRQILHRLGPDAAVVLESAAGLASVGPSSGAATLSPHVLPQEIVAIDQPTQKFLEIHGLPERKLITTIELLSPSNKKSGDDRSAFLAKRVDLLRHGVNVVDLDLLLAGKRLPLRVPLPTGDYHAFVTRAYVYKDCEVYSWSMRDPLPTIAIPLRTDEPDVLLPLQPAFNWVYDRSRYSQMLHYDEGKLSRLSATDREWALALLLK